MMSEVEYQQATEMESQWALWGGVVLVVAFLCPLIAGPNLIMFTDLLGSQSVAGVRVITLAPLLAGAVALFSVFRLEGLSRPMALILAAGFCNIVIFGVADAYLKAFGEIAHRLPPQLQNGMVRPGGTLVMLQAAVTLQFVGLAYTKLRPDTKSGPVLAGSAGIAILVIMVLPVNGMMIKLAFDGNLWSNAWYVPATLLLVLAFSAIAIAIFLGLGERDELSQLGLLVGGAMVLAPGLGIFLATLSVGGMVVLMAITATIKVYGTFVALHMLFAAGLLGWLVHGVQPE